MNAPEDPRQDDAALDAAWRALRDDGAPSPAVRAAILTAATRAAQAARDRPASAGPGGARVTAGQRAANDAHWKLKALAAIALLGLIGLVAQQDLRWRPAGAPAAPPAAPPVASAAREPGAPLPESAPPAASASAAPEPAPAPPSARQYAKSTAVEAAPAETGWAADTEAFLRDLIERRGGAAAAITVHCDAARCELAGDAPLLRELVHAPELAGRLRLVGDAEGAGAGAAQATRMARAASAERAADAASAPAGPAAGPSSGVVRYTLARVSVP